MADESQAESRPTGEKNTPAGWKERARSRLGVSPHAVAGALHDADPDKELSEAQVRQRLGKFGVEAGK